MVAAGLAYDDERLPWLEPYRDDRVPTRRGAVSAHRGLAVIGGGLAALVAVSAGFWLDQHEWSPRDPSIAPVEQSVTPVPVVKRPAAALAPAAPAPIVPGPVAQAPASRDTPAASPVPSKMASSSTATPVRPALRPNDRSSARTLAQGPAGRVVQLGAFGTAARAQAAYRTRIARYPLLGSMPRAVVRVVSQPDGQLLYALRIGTASRQQSGVVCRNLRASGDHCLVIG